MTADATLSCLAHHFLVATPGLNDALFGHSVVYVCEHNEKGALGLVLNKPSEMRVKDLFAKVDLPLARHDLQDDLVGVGGPLHTERGFVLHDPMGDEEGSVYASSLQVPGGFEMTTSRDVLEALSVGAGPKRVRIMLGYASWGEGQLESELAENNWLTVAADASVVFDTPAASQWQHAVALLGLDSGNLAVGSGHC
jgi:putative transcriptional regulator